ncbi:MAG TPA: DUF2905 domain-containing protein [Syntrophomonadaceae bacterium]|nr:DUF2905 domain-containing protein [Syntrophomonadaceae bacterium]
MDNFSSIAKMLMLFGILLLLGGGLLYLLGRISPLGRLPGDIFVRRGSFTFYFPIVTCLLLSLLLTLVLNLFWRR